jgi:hypothetical protein
MARTSFGADALFATFNAPAMPSPEPGQYPTRDNLDGTPRPNYDRFALPHVLTFSSILSTAWKTYWHDRWDEALRHGRENALSMTRDAFLMGLMQERVKAVTSLKWEIQVDDENDPLQMMVKDHLTKAVRATPYFMKFRSHLAWCSWYGRTAAQVKWKWKQIDGRKTLTVADHIPINGDKIGYTFDHCPYVLIYPPEEQEYHDAELVFTTVTKALVLRGTWRERFVLARHEIVDHDYFSPEQAGAIGGVGVRDVVFALDWIRKEISEWDYTYLERVGLGLTVWKYQGGNDQSYNEVKLQAEQQSRRANILVPTYSGKMGDTIGGVERLETPIAGVEAIQALIMHVEEIQERFVVGQSGSASSDSGGLGTHSPEFMQDTKYQLTKFDAENLGEAMTGSDDEPGLISMIKDYTFPDLKEMGEDFPVRLVINVPDPENETKLTSVTAAAALGVDFIKREVRQLTGLSDPQEGDDTIGGEKALAQEAQAAGHKAPPALLAKYPELQETEPEETGLEADNEGGGQESPFGRGGSPLLFEKNAQKPAKKGAKKKTAKEDDAGDGQNQGESGHWVTIGSKNGSGGSPVYIENGRITKGHTGLKGKPIAGLEAHTPRAETIANHPLQGRYEKMAEDWKKAEGHSKGALLSRMADTYEQIHGPQPPMGDVVAAAQRPGNELLLTPVTDPEKYLVAPAQRATTQLAPNEASAQTGNPAEDVYDNFRRTNRQEMAADKTLRRGVWTTEAAREGIHPKALHQLAAEMIQHDKAFKNEKKKMLKEARRMSKGLGYGDLSQLKRKAANGIDADAVKGLDDIAPLLRSHYPGLISEHNGEEELFNMLSEGNPTPLTEDEAYQEAMNHLLEQKATRGRQEMRQPGDEEGDEGGSQESGVRSQGSADWLEDDFVPGAAAVPFSRHEAALYGGLFDAWDEQKHPRGQPENAGEFGPGGAGSGEKDATQGAFNWSQAESTKEDRAKRAQDLAGKLAILRGDKPRPVGSPTGKAKPRSAFGKPTTPAPGKPAPEGAGQAETPAAPPPEMHHEVGIAQVRQFLDKINDDKFGHDSAYDLATKLAKEMSLPTFLKVLDGVGVAEKPRSKKAAVAMLIQVLGNQLAMRDKVNQVKAGKPEEKIPDPAPLPEVKDHFQEDMLATLREVALKPAAPITLNVKATQDDEPTPTEAAILVQLEAQQEAQKAQAVLFAKEQEEEEVNNKLLADLLAAVKDMADRPIIVNVAPPVVNLPEQPPIIVNVPEPKRFKTVADYGAGGRIVGSHQEPTE